MSQKSYQLLRSQQDFDQTLEYLKSHPIVGFDIETNSSEEIDAKVIGIGLASRPDEGFYLCLREWNVDTQTLEPQFPPEVELTMMNKLYALLRTKELVMHNGVYDIAVMWHRYQFDLTPHLLCDTILLKHTVDEERPFGLKEIAMMYSRDIGFSEGEMANQEQSDLKEAVIARGGKWTKKNKQMFMGPTDLLSKYCCADVDLTLKIFDYLESTFLEKEGLWDFFYNKEVMPLYRHATIPMKLNGLFIDVDYFKNLKNEVEDGIIKLTDEVFALISDVIEPKVKAILDDDVQITKTGLFASKALQYYNITPILSKKTDKPTLAKSALRSLELQYPDHVLLKWLLWDRPEIEIEEQVETVDPVTGDKGIGIIRKKVPDLSAVEPTLPESVIYEIKKDIYVERHPDRPHVFNLGSSDHLAWLIFGVYKCTATNFSRKTAKAQVDKKSLEKFGHLPFVKALSHLKREEKMLSTYIIPILEKHRDGWLYPSMFQFGTTSGRYSCGGGLNLQTLPRGDKRIKKGFIAPPGYKVVNADFSSLEPRIFAWVSGDAGLKEVYLKGLDLYSKIAIDVFKLQGVSAKESDDNFLKKLMPKEREKSKVFTLAVPYGANEWRIAELMKVKVQEAKAIIQAYLGAYPDLCAYMAQMEEDARDLGFVKSKFGRVRHLPRATDLYYGGHGQQGYGDLLKDKLQMALEFAGAKGRYLFRLYKENIRKQDPECKAYAKELRAEIMVLGRRGVEIYYEYRNLLNNAKNSPIQMTAAHTCNAAMIKLALAIEREKLDAWIALQIHDEICCISSEKDAKRVAELMQDAMENNWVTQEIDIPILAVPTISDNFAEAK